MYSKLTNGDIEFFQAPAKPIPMENYKPDPNNPRLYRMSLPLCEHRVFRYEKLPCGSIVGVWECKYFQRTISPDECRKCEKISPPA